MPEAFWWGRFMSDQDNRLDQLICWQEELFDNAMRLRAELDVILRKMSWVSLEIEKQMSKPAPKARTH